DAHLRDLTVRDNVFFAETTPGGVRAAVAARISLNNDAGQATGPDVRFEGNVFTAIAHTADPAVTATAVSLAEVGPGTGLTFQGNVFESNHRTLLLGDRADSYGAAIRDVLLVGNTHRRSAAGPARGDFQAV